MGRTTNRIFGAVSTGLMIGHGLVAVSAIAFGLFVAIQLSPARQDVSRLEHVFLVSVIATVSLHLLLMLATALWSGLAARGQRRVSRVWAWLGYFIPIAGLWLPPQTLYGLAVDAGTRDGRLLHLIVAWGIARGLAAPSATIVGSLIFYVLKTSLPPMPAFTYWVVTIAASNLLSLLMISQMRRHLATGVIDERHAEVFS